MMSNLEFYSAMASYTATHLTDSWQKWTAFLTTASRLYKYPFHEQLMIFAQRPDATACAEYNLWNDTMRRYVRRGSKGIALVDNSREKPRLRYVFDISDTGLRKNSRHPFLWELRPEHEAAVAQALTERFGAPPENNLAEQLESIAAQLVSEYWVEHKRDILDIVDGSFLEGYDEFNIGVQFRNAATVSITYSLLSRCGLEPEGYFDHEDFLSIFDFNTPEAVAALGTAVSQSNQQVLRQIGITIQNYERAKFAERSVTHGEQPDLHEERRLPDPRPEAEETKPLGRYGRMRRDYLKEHRPVLFNAMMVSGKLYPHLAEIEQTMNQRLEQMMPELMQAAGVTEELKARDPMTWAGLMNNCKAQAEEILLTELIYS